MLLENAGEIVARKLAALVGVENLWWTASLDSVFERINTEGRVQRVRQAPRQHASRVPVDHSHQIDEPSGHRDIRDIRDIGRPHHVRPIDCEALEKLRIDLVCMVRFAGVPLRVNRCQAHRSHKPLNSFSVDDQISVGQPRIRRAP